MFQVVDAGSWPAWVSAAISLVALTVASITLRNNLADRRMKGASAVDVYFDGDRGAVVVHNGGDQSVYQLMVVLLVSGMPWDLRRSRQMRLAPKGDGVFPVRNQIADPESQGDAFLKGIVTFKDGTGRSWQRDSSGRLVRSRWWRAFQIKDGQARPTRPYRQR